MSEPSKAISLSLQTWDYLSYYIVVRGAPDYRTQWASSLRDIYVHDKATFPNLQPTDMFHLFVALEHLEDQEPNDLLVRYFCSSNEWKSGTDRKFGAIVKLLALSNETEDDAWHAIITQVENSLLTSGVSSRHLWDLIPILGDKVPVEQRTSWAAAILARDGNSPSTLAELREPDIKKLEEALQRLNVGSLGKALNEEWHRLQGSFTTCEGSAKQAAFWWRVCFLRVAAAPASDRDRIWDSCLNTLAEENLRLPEALTPEVQAFLQAQAPSAATYMEDILAIGVENPDTWAELHNLLNAASLSEAVATVPGDMEDSATQAYHMEISRPQEALRLYLALAKSSKHNKDIRELLEWRILRLLATQPERSGGSTQKLLDDMLGPDHTIPSKAFDFAVRLLIRRVAGAPDHERRGIWDAGLSTLDSTDRGLSSATMIEIDKTLSLLSTGSSLRPLDMLTDILCLVPDRETMLEVQSKRIAAYTALGDKENALRALRLEIAIAAGMNKGPAGAIEKANGLFHSQTEGDDGNIAPWSFLHMPRQSSEGQSRGRVVNGPLVDDLLKDAARQAIGDGKRRLVGGNRRLGFLLLFSGRPGEGLRSLHAAMGDAPIPSCRVHDAVAEIAACVAIAEGNFACSLRYFKWLASMGSLELEGVAATQSVLDVLATSGGASVQTEAAGAAKLSEGAIVYRNLKQHERQRLAAMIGSELAALPLNWGYEAFRKGDADAARLLWENAILTEPEARQEQAVQAIAYGLEADGCDTTPDLLQDMAADTLPASTRRILLRQAGALLFSRQRYKQFLKVADDLAGLSSSVSNERDTQWRLWKGLSLVRMGQKEKALEVLSSAGNIPGTPGQHAQAAFLIGWIQMSNGEMVQAEAAFDQLISVYPQTAASAKARCILARLKTQ